MFTLGRAIDMRYKSNIMILGLTLMAAILGWIFTGEGVLGLYLGGGVFLSWALARELDPAHALSAFVVAILSFSTFLSTNPIQVTLIFWLLLLMRVVNRITGKKLTLVDVVSTLGFTVFLSFSRENSLYLLLFMVAIVSLVIIGERSMFVLISSSFTVILFLGQTIFMDSLSFISLGELDYLTGSLLILTFLSVPLFWKLSKANILDDLDKKVSSVRIFSSQLVYALAIILFTLYGSLTINDQLIHLAVILGIMLYHLSVRVFIFKY
ncbi:hypothetical protein SAMN05421734_101364 [Pelagirhabdus alkalitolerans]|uniref:Uncharacterized protein n=2 Tax=Pelagirhabdus alkalitolerans TaxID=1612202 RepID=A0A1G6GPP5_9BACI|nr:hypothetical protein SAMN05421734_101364 [Pelagirhabdus alkalitolerans]